MRFFDVALTRARVNLEAGEWTTTASDLHRLEESETGKKESVAIIRAQARLYSAQRS